MPVSRKGSTFGRAMPEEIDRCFDITARLKEVSMKSTAAVTVSLLKNVPGPRLPKIVWLEPPKAAPISAQTIGRSSSI